MRRVYLDNNATTPVLPAVLEAMRPYLEGEFGNAASIHWYGQQARAAVERAREQVAALIGARPAEIVFTSGGTEGDNKAIFGVCEAGDHVVTSKIEHAAVRNSCQELEKRGIEVTYLGVDSRSLVDPDDVRKALRPNTKLISIMYANNETGSIQPVEEIGKIAGEADVWFHTDGVQAAGKIAVDVEKIGCDMLAISGHKLHAPKGVGALYVRKGSVVRPLMYGGTHERGRRPGTENVPGIVGLGKACEIAKQAVEDGTMARVAELRDRLEQSILRTIEECGVNGEGAPRVPNTSNVFFDHIEGEPLLIALDLKGVAVATGAACSSGAIEPSPVLLALGLGAQRARGSIRWSLSKLTTAEDIEYALTVVPEAVARLREISPTWRRAPAATR
ncbi:MAG TPA: cysteine desulfurase family protein [Terriglobales bacterium]|nr:cysteine desulfurase family protein [Terriglobales bacterium]